MRLRFVLGFAVLLSGCSGGGTGGTPPIPAVPWGTYRHDTLNSAGGGIIDHNDGEATLLASLTGKVTVSSPAVDRNGDVIIGTTNGLISLDGNPHCSNNTGLGCRGDSCLPDGGVCNSCAPDDGTCICYPDGGSCSCADNECQGGRAMRCTASDATCHNDGECGPDGGTCECVPDDGTCTCTTDGGTCSCLLGQCRSGSAIRCSISGQPCNTDTCGSDQGTCTGIVRWVFDQFDPNDCNKSCPSPPCVSEGMQAVGPVSSSPAVTAGDTIVFGTDPHGGEPGRLFAIHQNGDQTPECRWVFPRDATPPGFGVKSSAATQVYNLDLSLISAFVGSDDGLLRAFNFDGSVRWTVPAGGGSPITSSPAIDTVGNIYVTSADGFLSSIDSAGSLAWRFPIGIAPAAQLYPSPAVSTTIFAIGTNGVLFAINPTISQTPKWQFSRPNSIVGSPSFLPVTFAAGALNVTDTIVFVVDNQGTTYGVRDLDGSLMPIQRCSETAQPNELPLSCRTDSCLPFGQICDPNTARCCPPDEPDCENGAMPNLRCTRDSCLPDLGMCTVANGTVSLTGSPIDITTSPIVSGDQFVVVGTPDGRICARALDNTVPGSDLNTPTENWAASGCIAFGNGKPTRSSPAIGLNNTIYVTTDAGLYVIK